MTTDHLIRVRIVMSVLNALVVELVDTPVLGTGAK